MKIWFQLKFVFLIFDLSLHVQKRIKLMKFRFSKRYNTAEKKKLKGRWSATAIYLGVTRTKRTRIWSAIVYGLLMSYDRWKTQLLLELTRICHLVGFSVGYSGRWTSSLSSTARAMPKPNIHVEGKNSNVSIKYFVTTACMTSWFMHAWGPGNPIHGYGSTVVG